MESLRKFHGKYPIKKILLIICAFLIPVLFFRNVFLLPGITQGSRTILTSDLNGQYVSYFLYFRNAILNGEGLLYSYSLSLGGDTFALLGYYMFNPLNLLTLLYPAERISSAIYLIITCKAGLAGVSCYLYFAQKHKASPLLLLFSSSYALSGYVFSFFMNLMWLDSLYFLPLVAMGLDRLAARKRSGLYVISLALAIVFCYYTGYMLAGFSLLYFVYLLIREKRGRRQGAAAAVRYMAASALAVMLSAFALLPTLLSQMGNRSSSAAAPVIEKPWQAAAKLFTAVCSMDDFQNGLPQIYCGMAILLLCTVYFLTNRISIRRKVGAFFLIAAFFLSFSIVPLDMVWHGFTYPNSFLHRYSFLLIFVLIMLAEEIFAEVRGCGIAGIVLADVLLLLLAAMVWRMGLPMVSAEWLAGDAAALLVISVLFYFSQRENAGLRYAGYMGIALLQLLQLFLNAGSYVQIHSYDDFSCEGYYNEMAPVIQHVKSMDNGFYRMEKTFYHSLNDPMMLSYGGVSHFSSASKTSVREFLEKIGYTKRLDLWISYGKGATPAGDGLLGIKYVLSQDRGIAGFSAGTKYEDYFINENPYALPIGMLCPQTVFSTVLEDKTTPFLNQQRLYDAVCGRETQLFHAYETPELILDHIKYEDTYYTNEEGGDGVITLEFTAQDENPVYLYLPAELYPGLDVSVNGVGVGEYLTLENHGILPLGSFGAGDKVTVCLSLQGGYAQFGTPQIYSLDLGQLGEIASGMQALGWSVLSHTNTRTTAAVRVPENDMALLMTIPYDKNWKFIVDGEECSAAPALGLFMALPLSQGMHTVTMVYRPAGLLQGGIASLAGFVLFGLLLCLERKGYRRREAEGTANEEMMAAPEEKYGRPQKEAAVWMQAFAADEAFLLKEYEGRCQMCGRQTGAEAQFIPLFAYVVPEQESRMFPGWNKICLCHSCAEGFRSGKRKLPAFFELVKHKKAEPGAVYTTAVQTEDGAGDGEALHYTAAHLSVTQKAVYLFQWTDLIERYFRF